MGAKSTRSPGGDLALLLTAGQEVDASHTPATTSHPTVLLGSTTTSISLLLLLSLLARVIVNNPAAAVLAISALVVALCERLQRPLRLARVCFS